MKNEIGSQARTGPGTLLKFELEFEFELVLELELGLKLKRKLKLELAFNLAALLLPQERGAKHSPFLPDELQNRNVIVFAGSKMLPPMRHVIKFKMFEGSKRNKQVTNISHITF